MDMTRGSVTVASRIMLPTYVGLAGVYGLVYLFDPFNRLQYSHGLVFQRSLTGGSMVPWGVFFLCLAGFLALQMFRHQRTAYVFVLCITAAIWLSWSICYVVSVVQDPKASLLAPVPTFVYFVAGVASALSLMAREV